MDWIGVALAIVGIGLALLPMAVDHFPKYLHTPAIATAFTLIILGLCLCVVPFWKRWREKHGPIPLAALESFLSSQEPFSDVGDLFAQAVVDLAGSGRIRIFGIRGEMKDWDQRLVEIPPTHFKTHKVWISPAYGGGYVSETYSSDKPFLTALASDNGRYFNLHANRNCIPEIGTYLLSHKKVN